MKRSAIIERLKSPIRVVIGLSDSIQAANEQSYYPEEIRKTKQRRIKDNLFWLFKYKEANRFYNLYGFDLIKSIGEEEQYTDYLSFAHERDEKNLLKEINSQVILLRDKYLFYKYMKSNNLPVPEVFATTRKGILYDLNMDECGDEILENRTDYFAKEIDGECASFVLHISDYRDYIDKKSILNRHNLVFQKAIHQIDEMSRINDKAINTLRIVTVYNHGNPYVLTSLLRVGTQKTNNVDNWAKGGLAVGIKSNGYLKKYGYYKPHFGTKTDIHPDSRIRFEEFAVPYWNEACGLACNAHKFFYNVQTIGWDIAITDKGPCFIEGNDNWEISLQQVVDNGLKKQWKKAMKDSE